MHDIVRNLDLDDILPLYRDQVAGAGQASPERFPVRPRNCHWPSCLS